MTSPDKRQNLVFHLFFVLTVALQALFQHGFFVANALGNQWDIQQHDSKRNGRSQHQMHHQKEDGGGHVHRMANHSVEACVDDFMVLLHLDGAREVGVFAQDFGIKEITHQKEHGSYPNCPIRQQAPLETPIEASHDTRACKKSFMRRVFTLVA